MSLQEAIMIAGMLAVTFLVRYVLLAMADHFQMPSLMERALYYVPPAVLTAIILPSVLLPQGRWDISWGNAYIFGSLAALGAGILMRKHTLMASIICGLFVFFLWRFLFS
ncbi:AzlD domain-containing protein [Oceanispirochaeta sp.]|jgi:branched-subunit amino acid transport protein|uniref:AzlD domain-containing protein n=1 Tax=Oceanispirochaeta sp. TaxID=2035350 RepID=UPI002613AA59|nr:AzlD domain-containing protein [Oceanispirochaeta sp.]MDA3959046.1 AzlD domain-containing protein [Oceanispirochaeta sp.]